MAATRLSTLKMSQAAASQAGDEDPLAPDSVVVEIPATSKFGFAWPAEQPSPASLPTAAERPVTLSSSEGETDVSEEEPSAPVRRQLKPEDFGEESEFVTPTNHLNVEQNPMDQVGRFSAQRRLSRAFSMPLPSQLGSLLNPRRTSSSGVPSPAVERSTPPEPEHFRELSLELADSVQMVIQTLLQLSPPQVLDPAKEQFSACSLSIPTPSISAMFTSLKNLNYMSANMSALGFESYVSPGSGPCMVKSEAISNVQSDFDVGEMVQSVGDAISGVAAHSGVDLVLFHGDVGMKHIAVRGDESGLSYTLSHIARQIVGTAASGDTVEIGLFIESLSDSQDPSTTDPLDPISQRIDSPSLEEDGVLRCVFHISHRFSHSELETSETEDVVLVDSRPRPTFDSLILRRLLRHLGATLLTDLPLKSSSTTGRVCELVLSLERGDPSVVNPTVITSPEDAAVLGYPDMHIASEPTLDQLSQFTETLKGKSVTLYANSKGSFAHHLSSYLTAWGMNVIHMSTEPGAEGEYERWDEDQQVPPPVISLDIPSPQENAPSSSPPKERRPTASDPAFILIDDDVAVLRSRLQKIKAEQAYPLSLHARKRPSLAANHRPRSSPQVARVIGFNNTTPLSPQVVVHFTSLSNFKLVKDAIQSFLTPTNGTSVRIPEIIVIPKPAGPRRFLTALHTAITRPVVDPFFVPTATSPMSPGLHSISPFFNASGVPKSPGARSAISVRTASDRSTRSPKEFTGEPSVSHHPPSPLAQSESREYFPDAVVKLGHSPATGVLIQSPDGQPTGIVFHPGAKMPSSSAVSVSTQAASTKPQDVRESQPSPRYRGYRVPSGGSEKASKDGLLTASSSSLQPQSYSSSYSVTSDEPEAGSTPSARSKSRQSVGSFSEELPPASIEQTLSAPPPGSPENTQSPGPSRGYMIRRQSGLATSSSSPPTSPQARSPNGQMSTRRGRRSSGEGSSITPSGSKKGKSGPSATEGNIVPPISVLIVDDNPINQTILSTFMRRKKIKYDVAKNGEEAVQKWRSGIFHLILMDIQMPVMDGIQATKEIRRIEKQNAGFPSTPQSEGQRTPSEASTTSESRTPAYRSSVIIVALTASSLQADRVAALAAGCNDFLTKPVSLDWLNSKIIEWGSIKALQMWAEIRPEVVKSISTGQAAQAQAVARRLHVPEGRTSMSHGVTRSRSSSLVQKQASREDGGGGAGVIRTTVSAPDKYRSSTDTLVPGTSSAQLSTQEQPPSEKLDPGLLSLSAISAMSPSEAAMTLAGHKPQVPVADVKIPAESLVAAVEELTSVPSSSLEEQVLQAAASAVLTPRPQPASHTSIVVDPSTTIQDEPKDHSFPATENDTPHPPRQPDPQ